MEEDGGGGRCGGRGGGRDGGNGGGAEQGSKESVSEYELSLSEASPTLTLCRSIFSLSFLFL